MKALNTILMSGREVLPLVEGGKGISVSNGESSGAWALAGGVGTFSGVNADSYDAQGHAIPQLYFGKTRRERHEELLAYAIKGGIAQARIAWEASGGKGRIHMNVLWEMAGAERVLHGVLEGAKGLIHGVTCGAGMPYRIAEICAQYGVHYYPIVSSARAFRALWKRAYHKFQDWLGAVVYEDPWLAGGHNGLSNVEDPTKPGDPYPFQEDRNPFLDYLEKWQTRPSPVQSGPPTASSEGAGFFAVRNGANVGYTRAGNFSFDDAGNLISPDGWRVQGYTQTDPVTGNIVTTQQPTDIVIPPGVLRAPTATTQVRTQVNLDPNVAIDAVNPEFTTSIQMYDALGSPHVLTVNFNRTGAGAWTYTVTVPQIDVTGVAGVPVTLTTGNLTFNGAGVLTAPATDITIPGPATWANGATPNASSV